jgi:hypothetical protein
MGNHERPEQEYEPINEAPTNSGLPNIQTTPEEQRLHELEYMIWLQGNTISAFQRRVYKLEMEIVELISGATPLLTPEESDAQHPH